MASNFDFTESLANAIKCAQDYANAQVHPVHIASALLNEGAGEMPGGLTSTGGGTSLFSSVISRAGGDPTIIKRAIQKAIVRLPTQSPPPDETTLSSQSLKVLREAQALQKQMHDSYIAQDHLLLALLKDSSIAAILKEANLTEATLKTAIEQIRGNRRVESKSAEQGFDALQKYAVDLTSLAEEGKIDPVIGRDNEIRRAIRILCRRTKNNPVLIGEPGVGKTSIAEGLAQRIVNRDVPASLIARLYSLDMGALMAGAKYKGEYEERIKSVLNEVEKATDNGGPGVILFIDELHLIMAGRGGEGGGMDAANLFKPLLARGKLRCIGATTLAEYRKYIETDAALERRFAQVIVNEPSVSETISILRGIRERYEVHHGVRIHDGALIAAATLAHRYLTSRRLPDAAIDLVDEACASVRVTRETEPENIDKLQRRKLELEVEIHALEREKDEASKELLRPPDLANRLQQLEAKKAAEDAAIGDTSDTVTAEEIAEIVARWTSIPVTRLILLRMEKILSSSVVGQADAVKAVANAIRLSRSGLTNPQRPIASFLLAGPSGYWQDLVGKDMLPYTIVLIDEVEKACREFVTLFLQVLDDGRLTDGQGRLVDFRNTVIIMTSNLGAAFLNDMGEGPVNPQTRALVMGAIQVHFPPEFINRIDETVIFRTLSRKNVLKIVDIRLKEVEERLADRKITLDVDPEAKAYLVSVGWSPQYGARPLNRAIQSELLHPLSMQILSDRVRDSETVKVRFDGPSNRLVIVPNHEGAEAPMDVDSEDDIEIEEMD
ncbi:P-loop containing nucleoside triphosphate hydrolase protein [Mycena latifolia]|nr:P-loop containing nucleoside triphosphate hydrolase protein [Mycena latifolia]